MSMTLFESENKSKSEVGGELSLPTLNLGQPDRYMTEAEGITFWRDAYSECVLKPNEMGLYRTVAAWRLTRAIAFKQGRLSLDERLSQAFPKDAEWEKPVKTGVPVPKPMMGPERWTLPDLLSRDGGLALTPVNDNGSHLTRFSCAIEKLSEHMWMRRGSTRFPKLGQYGLHGLTHPETIAQYWPSKERILAFEEEIIEEIQKLVLRCSRQMMLSHIRNLIGLSVKEAGGLIALATEEARRGASQDIETKRFVVESRILDYVDRAREALDTNSEIKGLKLYADVAGLRQAEPENTMDAFVGAIARVSSARSGDTLKRIEISEDNDD